MSDFTINFNNPWLLFALIPLLLITFIPFFRIPKKFRGTRNRVISVTLHTLAIICITALFAGLYFTFTVPNRENEILIVVDASDSNEERAEQKEDYVESVLRMTSDGFKVGVVKFGFDQVYAAELSYDIDEVFRQYIASPDPDTSASDIASALEFASEQFTHPRTSKIVLISDGLQTDSEAMQAAQIVSAHGTKIDTVAFPNEDSAEVQIANVKLPEGRITENQSVTITVTVENTLEEPASATLEILDNGFPNTDEPAVSVTLEPGTQDIELHHTFLMPGMHDIIVRLTTGTTESGAQSDRITENNVFQSYLDITVFDNILILENISGEAADLSDLLSERGGYTNVVTCNVHTHGDMLPRSAKELCEYNQVILCNISNADLTSSTVPENFVNSLYSYVYDMGGSMFTVGGQNDTDLAGNSTAHAYSRTDLEGTMLQEMLPVQAVDYTPPAAVMIVVDSSGSMSMGKFEAAQAGAEQTLNALYEQNKNSYCGVMTFNTSATETVQILPVSRHEEIREAITNLGKNEQEGSGGTVFSGAIDRAGRALAAVNVPIKHIVLITDGNPDDHLHANGANDNNYYGRYIDWNNQNGITMSIVTVGADSTDAKTMGEAAEYANGEYYSVAMDDMVTMASEIYKAMSIDLQAVTVNQIEEGIDFVPEINGYSPIFNGIDTSVSPFVPELHGYYGTRPKADAVTPLMYQYVPIYAEWNFGAGKVGSFMSDVSLRSDSWSRDFISSDAGKQLICNMAENLAPLTPPEPDVLDMSVRQTTNNFTNRLDVFTTLNEGESLRVSIVLDPGNVSQYSNAAKQAYINGVPVTAAANNMSFNFTIQYTGIYLITIEKLDSAGTVISDLQLRRAFSYSDEYDGMRKAEDGTALMADIALNGNGNVLNTNNPAQVFASFEARLDGSFNPALVLLIIAAVCILLDIAVRKFKFKWLHEIIRDKKAMKEVNSTSGKEATKFES